MAQYLKEERPGDGIKGTREVELKHHPGCPKLAQHLERLPDEHKVVVEAPPDDERVLVAADKAVELWSKPERESLSENLGHDVNEAYRAVVAQLQGVGALRQQRASAAA